MNTYLLRLLAADNPWLEGAPIEPWLKERLPPVYLPRRLNPRPEDHRVSLVVGPRQAGKSTLVWKTLSDIGEPALYLNCEEPSIREWLSSPAVFLADLEELAIEIPTLFFEETQNLEEAGLFLKGLVDRRTGKAIYATGSSSFHLEAKTRESLAGRAQRHLLLPLSLEEVANVTEGAPAIRQARLRSKAEEMMLFGSYPPVFLSDEPQRELAGLVEAFIVRDASDRFRLRYPAALRRILELAASQIGNLVNFSEWAALTGVSNDTVAEYCRLLEETHVLRLVRPFVGGKRAELTSAPKAFFLDNGIRNQLFGGFEPLDRRPDRGALVENFVFTELAKSTNPLLDSIRYWRSKSGTEVDFVVRHQGRLLALEVKAGSARGRVSRGARGFIETYQPEIFAVVGRESGETITIGATAVRFTEVVELPALLREWLLKR